MNRSLTNVLFGGIGTTVSAEPQKIEGTITKTTVDDTVEALSNADSVILVILTTLVLSTEHLISYSRWLDMEWLSPKLSMPSRKYVRFFERRV